MRSYEGLSAGAKAAAVVVNSLTYHWHCFIDHLAEGKDAESFFAEFSN